MFDFSEMLPVGMVAHGGQVARIMAEIAQRQRGIPGWEAFHYEKISDSAVELTGGVVSQHPSGKRWLEPHDCVTIPLSAVIAEMQVQGLLAIAPATQLQVENRDSLAANRASGDLYLHAADEDTLLNVTFSLPTDSLERQRILQTFHLQADIVGATIIACRLERKKLN